jgi:hypothetical protein
MKTPERRSFLSRLFALGGAAAASSPLAAQSTPAVAAILPAYARAMSHQSLKQSSYDPSGGNRDFWPIAAGETREVFNQQGPGMITHIWFTIAAPGLFHLKEIVLRMFWDGSPNASVEAPIGDFFGLNLAEYVHYESEYLACSPGKSLNCYFAMPFRSSARMTVTNEGAREVGAFYSNIDFLKAPIPADSLYFHAQYRQAAPPKPSSLDWANNGDANKLTNPTGRDNYVYCETRGRGHLMGVTLGVLQNQEFWMGEGDDMIFIDDESKPAIIGTGSEDYFLGSWNFGGRDGAKPFAYRQYGAQAITQPERTGGRYLCYRFHGDNPVTFNQYLKHTMEHGHANHRADSFFSCAYWYQARPAERFPALPAVADRTPRLHATGGPNSAVAPR